LQDYDELFRSVFFVMTVSKDYA